MKFLIVFALALCTASAYRVHNTKLGISNGEKAAVGELAYMVGLSFKPSSRDIVWCGGSLIDNQWILTAAHCTDGVTSVTVYLGSTVRTNAEVKYTVNPSDITIHAGWNSTSGINDISLIKIPATGYTGNIQHIKLPALSGFYSTYAGKEAVASGWGYTSDSTTSYATDLQWAARKVITNEECAKTYGSDITPSIVCISTHGGISPCFGDSGGPLVLKSSMVQIGLINFGHEDGCTKGYPVAFTRVTSYLDWIKEKTGISY